MESRTVLTPAGESALEHRIKLFLESVGHEDLRRLQVRVDRGVACLTGHVPSFCKRQLAISACQRVPGVYHVSDEIEVDS